MEKSNFQKAVEGTPEISTAYRSGLQALKRSDRSSVAVSDPWILDGSVDIDTAVQENYPNENRWDYAIGYSGKVCCVEVHPAYTSEVSTIGKKLRWLKTWLKEKAPLLDAIPKATPAFFGRRQEKVRFCLSLHKPKGWLLWESKLRESISCSRNLQSRLFLSQISDAGDEAGVFFVP